MSRSSRTAAGGCWWRASRRRGCPSCGVLSGLIKDRPTSRAKDLPHGAVAPRMWVRKRRFACVEPFYKRKSFTETSAQLPARARVTTRLKVKVSTAVTTTNRAVREVAKERGIAWWTVHRIRARSVRWIQDGIEQTATWRSSDPWMTSIVDLDPTHPGGIIGLAAGRSGACVHTGFRYVHANIPCDLR